MANFIAKLVLELKLVVFSLIFPKNILNYCIELANIEFTKVFRTPWVEIVRKGKEILAVKRRMVKAEIVFWSN